MAKSKVENRLPPAEVEPNIHVHSKTLIIVAAINFVYFAQLIAIVGAGLLAQPIAKLLGGSSSTVWLSSAINILTVALNLPIAQAADYWGRKWLLVICTSCGCIGSIIVSRAQSMGVVIVGFSILGISYGGQSLLFSLVSEVLPRKHRPTAQATVNTSAGVGAVIGLVMGGALLREGNLENFRIYWYIVAGIFAISIASCVICYNPLPRELQITLTTSEKLRQLDWVGYFLFAPGLTLFCIAMSWSRSPYQWSNVHILATFIIGMVMMISFLVYEWRFKRDGILHHNLFKSKNFPIALFGTFAEGLSFFTCNNYFAFEVSVLEQTDTLNVGLHFSIVFFSTMVFAGIFGLYSQRWKVVRTPLLVGFLSLLIFNILMATTKPSSPKGTLWGYPIFAGIGLGAILPSIMVAAQLSTPSESISTASGLMIAVRSLGGTIGLAINNAVFNDALTKNIPSKIAAATLPMGLPPTSLGMLIGALASGDENALEQIPGITPQIIGAASGALVEAYSIGFRNTWIAASCFTFIAVITIVFITDPRNEFNAHIDAPAEAELLEAQTEIEANDKGVAHSEMVENAG